MSSWPSTSSGIDGDPGHQGSVEIVPPGGSTPASRRARRREDTTAEIEARALAIMAVDGVGGLTMAAIARQMGIKPPSLYKHVDSLMGVYDGLFRRGQRENLAVLEQAIGMSEPGLPALAAGLAATARWAVANPVLAQLLFWRPVPGYHPSDDAFAPAAQIVATLRRHLRKAVRNGELGRGAASDQAMSLLSTLHFGVVSQHLANEPDVGWDDSRYTPLHARVIDLFVGAYPP